MNILFMCVANSARSQMAEGIAKKLLGAKSRIESAGSEPGELNPFAVKASSEIGIDISANYSKSVDDLAAGFVATLDFVVTLCADEVCPVIISNAKRLHWPIFDPAKAHGDDEAKIASFRVARDLIYNKISRFAEELSKG